jgi:hypothetical protein
MKQIDEAQAGGGSSTFLAFRKRGSVGRGNVALARLRSMDNAGVDQWGVKRMSVPPVKSSLDRISGKRWKGGFAQTTLVNGQR